MYKRTICALLSFSMIMGTITPTRAETTHVNTSDSVSTEVELAGSFESKTGFGLSEENFVDTMNYGSSSMGRLIVSGDLTSQAVYINAIPTLVYGSEREVLLSYELQDDRPELTRPESAGQNVGDVDFGTAIGKGAVLVQLSYDGEEWGSPVYSATNILDSPNRLSGFYRIEKSDIEKGVFIRVLIAYSTEDDNNSNSSEQKEIVNHIELYIARLISDSGEYATGDLSAEDDVEVGIGAAVLSDLTIAKRVVGEAVFHARQGHGFAGEAANIQAEKAAGNIVEHVGGDNARNGADYVIKDRSGAVISQIQSKYYKTASESINACFDKDTGLFRYYTSDGPMRIEVPKDQYSAAVQAMEKKIEAGMVPGITDPAEARNIVKEGEVTYKQAVNIAKAGTVESLKYDAKNSCVTAVTAFGISATIQFARSIWQHDSVGDALKKSIYTGLKVGGVSFATSILASQLSRAGLNTLIYHGAEGFLKTAVGYKAAALIANASRAGARPIYGAAAAKCAAKLFSSNAIIATITFVLFAIPDAVDAIRGRESVKQLIKNTATTVGGIAGGLAGAAGGAALGTAIFPGPGSVVGGIVGGVAGALGISFAVDKVGDLIAEDDAEEMVDELSKEFQIIAEEYLLTEEEVDQISEILSKELSAKMLKDMYAAKNREIFARSIIEPITKEVVKKRKVIIMPSEEEMVNSLIETLNEIYDAEQAEQ